MRLAPSSTKNLNALGFALAKDGQYARAIAAYTKVIELDALNANAFHNRGISYDKQGQHDLAVADFSRVLELDGGNANALFNRGSTHDSMGRYEEAIVSKRPTTGE